MESVMTYQQIGNLNYLDFNEYELVELIASSNSPVLSYRHKIT